MVVSKSCSSSILVLLVLVISGLVSAFELNEIQNNINDASIVQPKIVVQQECKNASVYEYVKNFSLPLNDVERLLTNQFSRDSIGDFESSNKVKLFNITYVSKLVSKDQNQSSAGPFKATVVNNQIELSFNFKLNITEGIPKKNYTFEATTKVSNVSISYEKEFKTETGLFTINSVAVKFEPSMMTSTFTPTPNKTDSQSLDTAIKGAAPSLYSTFSNLFSNEKVKQFMQTNSKGDHLSKIYPQNPYNYQFYATKISINLAPVSFLTKDKSLTTGMVGNFSQGNKFCSQIVPDFTDTSASLYFTKQFIQNFIEQNLATFAGWKNVPVDKTTIRTSLLQWQLLDLEFIVDGLWNDLGDYYQNEIKFTCDVKDQVQTKLDSRKNVVLQTMVWNCQGFVKINSTMDQKIMDFTPRITHNLTDWKIINGQISMYVNELQVVDCQFSEVPSFNGQGKYTVGQRGAKLAYKFIESVFNDFRIYPIGNKFKVNSNGKKVVIQNAGNGIWVI